jgi:3-phenylpropionate/trans-cinnamate dioxygenase ferredoxin reductase component
MPRKPVHVIVGAGLAGAKAAETLRDEGFDGRVVLIGDEPERPYERPPLSKGYLQGKAERDDARVHAAGFYSEHRIELRTRTTVERVDTAERAVELRGGERLRYDRLLIATGAEPRRLGVPGADLDGVDYLRDLADADALATALRDGGRRLVVVGAGWIGAEVAASARSLGAEVALVERGELPLAHVLGTELGQVYADLHRENGVELHTNAQVERFEGSDRVEGVRLAGGTTLDADLVVVGVGVVPRTELAARSGLAVDDGVLVDARLESSVPGVFAAGDLASAVHPLYGHRVRVEHWANALNQGPAAARAMLGQAVSYDRVPYSFSDQYDVGMEYAGLADPGDEVVFRGDPATREFIAFWLREGRVVAGMNVNVWDVTEPIQDLIRSGERVDVARLRDADVPLDRVVVERLAT